VLALAGLPIVAAGCIESRGVATPDLTTTLTLRLRPLLDSALANNEQSLRIARMHVEVRYEFSGEVLASGVQQIDPEQPDEGPIAEVEFEATTGDEFEIDGDLRLVGEDEIVQWSGIFGPTTVNTRTLVWEYSLEMGRGDLSSLSLTGVSLSGLDGGLLQGQTAALDVSVGGAGHDLVVFWGSKDPSIVAVDANGNVTGISPGEGTIVAAAGRHTASKVVQVLPSNTAASRGEPGSR